MDLQTYIDRVNTRYKTGITTEHSFRGELENLLTTLLPDVLTTNEPTRIKCGAPDYILTKKDIPVGYIEAKDLGADLNSKSYQEQFKRYKDALNNLIITNYLDFQVFKDGELVSQYSIGSITGNAVHSKPEQFGPFTTHLKDFSQPTGQTIKSASKLAGMMAVKAKMLADVIGKALQSDEDNSENSTLKDQLKAFKDILIHDIGPKEFADIYAQTIAYGMFAARLHDPTLPTFSRQEAAELIPKTNPFLRKLFQYIAGYDLDKRIVWIVDALADIFRATDVKAILKNFGKATQQNDPIIHFYETFLSEYDPKLRKARGVWYTPEPVVNFIVRAVDDILKTEFGLPEGLADTSKIKIKRTVQNKATADMRSKLKEVEIEDEVHKVQILDPATGTGTFLAEVVKHIYNGKFDGQQGIWSKYVEGHLIPRINGFELLMASYAMAHLKLDLLLSETGYKPQVGQRLKIFLTNSLEEYHPYIGELPFAGAISDEANQANRVKKDTPVMVILGNPPYYGFKSNTGTWITNLVNEYKFVDGENIAERKHRLGNDYVKFIRFGQYFIEKNREGILAYINDHGFLFNPTFKGMRWNLLNCFDTIYILDLHGNAKKKETGSDGQKDVNVFDIQQGVSVNIFIKNGKKKEGDLAQVFYADVLGLRELKYDFLNSNSISTVDYNLIQPTEPFFFFLPNKQDDPTKYEQGFLISELFKEGVTGTLTGNDGLLMGDTESELLSKLKAKTGVEVQRNYIKSIHYRPFEEKAMYFINGLNQNPYPAIPIPASYRSRFKLMNNMTKPSNFCLIVGRQGQVVGSMPWNIVFIGTNIVDLNMFYRGGGVVSPLYLYPEGSGKNGLHTEVFRVPNLEQRIVDSISSHIGLQYSAEKRETKNTYAPIDILDYIYAVLHSPSYREQYKEFLKIDFPRIPYPKDVTTFWELVRLGGQIRQLHLLEAPTVSKYITKYPIDGDNEVTKPAYKGGRVYINDTQYFDNVPQVAWEFYIGGYQPAQKWLKDRKERTLSFEDILHYQKMIVALTETDRVMKEIDEVDFM